MNPSLTHWAVNDGATDRIHLLIGLDGQEDLERAKPVTPLSVTTLAGAE